MKLELGHRLALWGVFTAVVVATACCNTDSGVKKDLEYVGSDALVSRAELTFKDGVEEARFDKVRACWQKRAVGEGWSHYPLRKIGNFIEEDWCRGPNSPRGCAGGNFREKGGAEWLGLNTLHYDREWPEVFGLGVNAGKLPDSPGWGTRFYWASNGGGVVGSNVHISFHRMEAGNIAESVYLGDDYAYEVHEGSFTVASTGSQDEIFARLLSSPQALRDEAISNLEALEAKTVAGLEAGEVQKCVYGKYKGDGIPPECTLTPLTEGETSKAIEEARAHLKTQRDLISTHHETFHGLLVQLFPADCWL